MWPHPVMWPKIIPKMFCLLVEGALYILLACDTEHVFLAQCVSHVLTCVYILKSSLQKPIQDKIFGDLLAMLHLEWMKTQCGKTPCEIATTEQHDFKIYLYNLLLLMPLSLRVWILQCSILVISMANDHLLYSQGKKYATKNNHDKKYSTKHRDQSTNTNTSSNVQKVQTIEACHQLHKTRADWKESQEDRIPDIPSSLVIWCNKLTVQKQAPNLRFSAHTNLYDNTHNIQLKIKRMKLCNTQQRDYK